MQKSKMAVWGGLTNSCEKKRSKKQRRKGKINPFECRMEPIEFQRIARRDKKAFFSDQCKEKEENNRMGKTRDLFWRRQWHPTPVFLPGESQGRGSLVGCRLWGRTESDTTEVT